MESSAQIPASYKGAHQRFARLLNADSLARRRGLDLQHGVDETVRTWCHLHSLSASRRRALCRPGLPFRHEIGGRFSRVTRSGFKNVLIVFSVMSSGWMRTSEAF